MKLERISPPYENPRQAYQHLLKYDANPTIPKEAPHAPVVLFVRNRFINFRSYESFEAISRYMNSNVFYDNVFMGPEHLRERFRELQVKKMYRMITGQRFPQDSPQDPFETVWAMFQEKPPVRMKAKSKSNRGNCYLFDLGKLAENDVKFPKQCMSIIAAVLGQQQSAYTLQELKFFSNDLHKYGLKTKSDPFKILSYYLPKLHEAGLVDYPRKQYTKEDEEE